MTKPISPSEVPDLKPYAPEYVIKEINQYLLNNPVKKGSDVCISEEIRYLKFRKPN